MQRLLASLVLIAVISAGPSSLGGAHPAAAAAGGRTAPGRLTAEQAIAIAINDWRPKPGGYERLPSRQRISSGALAGAAFPVAMDPEIGANDFRISDMGGDEFFDAINPAVAYNSQNDEFLVVWHGNEAIDGTVNPEVEIYGQRVSAATGAEVGPNDFRISDMGPDGDAAYNGFEPAVAYNSANNEYLVVWYGDDFPTVLDGEFEIFGQRLNAATGAEVGANDFRISDMGPVADASYDAANPAVAYDSVDNFYLVVWHGDESGIGTAADETEIFGQRLNAATGAQIGSNDFRLSDVGPVADASYDATDPQVAHDPVNNRFFVVWQADNDAGALVDGENEIYGQRLNAATGAEITPNDQRLSDMGPIGDLNYDAFDPAVAYNSTNQEFLVVWWGDDDTGLLVDGETEIYGQRVNAASSLQVGTPDFRISDMGPDGNTNYGALAPAVAYNGAANEYLVVWFGDTNDAPLTNDELEAFGQRLNAADGQALGANDFRLSDVGPDADAGYLLGLPGVAFSSAANRYLTIWWSEDDVSPLIDGEIEIFGQEVDAAGQPVGANDQRLSDMGGDTLYDVADVAVAYNSQDDEYLVVWNGDDGAGSLVENELEIYGQRLNAATGAEVGANDFRISDMGPDGNDLFDAGRPAVVYNAADNEYLVVWHADDNLDDLVEDEFEIYGQRLDASGAEIGANDFRISSMGATDGDTDRDAVYPSAAYNSQANEYLVTWYGDDDSAGLANDEFEIFGQRLTAAGAQVGFNDFRISDMGPDGDPDYVADQNAVAYNSAANEYLVVWDGDDNTGPLQDGENEIFGQRLNATTGAQVGANDFRISDAGPDGNVQFGASYPDVAFNSADQEYLVVWWGEDDTGNLEEGSFQIFAQRLDAAGAEIGANDFRVSQAGPDGPPGVYKAVFPDVTYGSFLNEYLVVWDGVDDNRPNLSQLETEVFGQRLSAAGQEIGLDDFRISDVGPDGVGTYGYNISTGTSVVAARTASGEYLAVWVSADNIPYMLEGEFEAFGQRLAADFPIFLPAILR